MRIDCLVAFGFGLLVATAASAQESGPCNAAGQPRDIATLRCQLAVDDERISQLDRQLRATETARVMAANDLVMAKQATDKRDKDLGDWFRGWFGGEKK